MKDQILSSAQPPLTQHNAGLKDQSLSCNSAQQKLEGNAHRRGYILVHNSLLGNNANNNRQGYISEDMLVSNFEGVLSKSELGHYKTAGNIKLERSLRLICSPLTFPEVSQGAKRPQYLQPLLTLQHSSHQSVDLDPV